jgi:ssDNA-binding Zn-finger/Zn-ribbon topoisomerase 1
MNKYKNQDEDSLAKDIQIEPTKTSSNTKCPKCNAKIVLREGKYGKFYGCSTFPKCNGIVKHYED